MNLDGTSNMHVTASATATTRMNMGIHQFFAACEAVARIEACEAENNGAEFGGFWEYILHDSLVVATMAVASLESYANELYFENQFIGADLKEHAARELADMIDKESILRKFSTALAFRANKQLNYGLSPTQNVDALIKLRNLVVHYRSEWSDQQILHGKASKALSGKFQPSPFLPKHEPIFPKGWASHSFGCWAIRSTFEFMAHFSSEAGVNNPLEKFRQRITELSRCAL